MQNAAMRRIFWGNATSLAMLLLLSIHQDLPACSCASTKPVKDALSSAHAVFIGKVVFMKEGIPAWHLRRQRSSQKTYTGAPGEGHESLYCRIESGCWVRLQVTKVFKGRKPKVLTVMTGNGWGDCGYPFVVGEEYLVYADACSSGILVTNICDRTTSLAEAGSDIRELDQMLKQM